MAGTDNVPEEVANIKTWAYMSQSLYLAHISLSALACWEPYSYSSLIFPDLTQNVAFYTLFHLRFQPQ